MLSSKASKNKANRLRPGSKKIAVKLTKAKPTLSASFEQDSMGKLSQGVDAVFLESAVSFSREELYSAVSELCKHGKAVDLYAQVTARCASHIDAAVARLSGRVGSEAVAFLAATTDMWTGISAHVGSVRAIFLYLDRTYALQAAGVAPIWDSCIAHLQQQLVKRQELLAAIVRAATAAIQQERGGESVDRSHLLAVTRMLLQLGLYEAHLRPAVLSEAEAFFKAEAAANLPQLPVPAYLQAAEERLKAERERALYYLDAHSTLQPLVRTVDVELLDRHAADLIDRGLSAMVRDDRTEDLARLLRLLSRRNLRPAHLGLLVRGFRAVCEADLLAVVNDKANEKDQVPRLLRLRARLDQLLTKAFGGGEQFQRALREASRAALNSAGDRPAELLAKFLDQHLKGARAASLTGGGGEVVEQVMTLFKAVDNKDTFEEFYKKDLAKRLLLGRSVSDDLERGVLQALKTECGPAYTNKLEGMFRDMAVARDAFAEFRAAAGGQGGEEPAIAGAGDAAASAASFDGFNVLTLTTTFWPSYSEMQLTLPPELAAPRAAFETFYLAKHTSRNLRWQPLLGTAAVRGNYPRGWRELETTEAQACVLLLFNDRPRWTLEELQARTGLENQMFRASVIPLLKLGPLVKDPPAKVLNRTDALVFNDKFRPNKRRVRLNLVQLRETAQEQQATKQKVQDNREHQVDACVVRIMKTRKTVSHQELVSEVLGQLRFNCPPQDIKKRITNLIDRDYLERDEQNGRVYHYVA